MAKAGGIWPGCWCMKSFIIWSDPLCACLDRIDSSKPPGPLPTSLSLCKEVSLFEIFENVVSGLPAVEHSAPPRKDISKIAGLNGGIRSLGGRGDPRPYSSSFFGSDSGQSEYCDVVSKGESCRSRRSWSIKLGLRSLLAPLQQALRTSRGQISGSRAMAIVVARVVFAKRTRLFCGAGDLFLSGKVGD